MVCFSSCGLHIRHFFLLSLPHNVSPSPNSSLPSFSQSYMWLACTCVCVQKFLQHCFTERRGNSCTQSIFINCVRMSFLTFQYGVPLELNLLLREKYLKLSKHFLIFNVKIISVMKFFSLEEPIIGLVFYKGIYF